MASCVNYYNEHTLNSDDTFTSSRIWNRWVKRITTSTPTSSNIYSTWVRSGNLYNISTTNSETNDGVFRCWVTTGVEKRTLCYVYSEGPEEKIFNSLKKTTEQLRAAKAQRVINYTWRRIKAEELRIQREEAEDRAKNLLLDLIGEIQLKVYEETGRLFVKGRKFDYIVRHQGPVTRISKNNLVDLCVHLKRQSAFSPTDNVVALKLSIEGDEESVLSMANEGYCRARSGELALSACM